jgi:hypothetical protein
MTEQEALRLSAGDRVVRPGSTGVVVQNLGTGTIFVDWKFEGRSRVSQEMHGARRDVSTWSLAATAEDSFEALADALTELAQGDH